MVYGISNAASSVTTAAGIPHHHNRFMALLSRHTMVAKGLISFITTTFIYQNYLSYISLLFHQIGNC